MRGGGFHDRSANKNSYPMTSAYKFPSAVTIRVNGEIAAQRELADDPADSRGILSWHAQPYDRTLHEAGSYGELLRVPLSAAMVAASERTGEIVIRLEVSDALPGGLAIYGSRFGRYPIEPMVLFVLRNQAP
jgi:predicted transcriptional regulator